MNVRFQQQVETKHSIEKDTYMGERVEEPVRGEFEGKEAERDEGEDRRSEGMAEVQHGRQTNNTTRENDLSGEP